MNGRGLAPNLHDSPVRCWQDMYLVSEVLANHMVMLRTMNRRNCCWNQSENMLIRVKSYKTGPTLETNTRAVSGVMIVVVVGTLS